MQAAGEREHVAGDRLADDVAVDAGAVGQRDAALAEGVEGEPVDAGLDRVDPRGVRREERLVVGEGHERVAVGRPVGVDDGDGGVDIGECRAQLCRREHRRDRTVDAESVERAHTCRSRAGVSKVTRSPPRGGSDGGQSSVTTPVSTRSARTFRAWPLGSTPS
jgi:hypothetical protein